jgi:hypothetical protein
MHLPLSPFLGFMNLQPWSIGIVIPIAAMIFAGVMALGGMYFAHRRRELWHQTARLALEKGQPLPPPLEHDEMGEHRRRSSPHRDFRAGLILIGTGIGLYVFLEKVHGNGAGYVGAIPGLIGVALLVSGWLRRLTEPPTGANDDIRPHS